LLARGVLYPADEDYPWRKTTLNVTVETTPESDAQFTVHLDWPAIDKASEKVYRRLAQNQKIPGFRPGHAPRAIIERMVGRDALYEEAIEDLVKDAVATSAREHEMTLLGAPHAHVHEVNYGQEHDVTVTVPVLGKGELADYHDIHVEQAPVEVTDEDIDRIIENARERNALWVPVDRPAQIGDRVTVALKLVIDDKTISDLKDHEFELTEERTGLYKGMDQEIVGMREGDTKDFTLTVPEDYAKSDIAGKPAHYTVTLDRVAVKELPTVDDEFARKMGDYASVEALRDAIRAELRQNRLTTARREMREKLTDALIERLTLVVPQVLIDAEVEDIIGDLERLLSRDQIDFPRYLQLMGKTLDDYRQEMRPEALRRIKQRRALELVAEHEGLTVTPQDVQRVLDAYNVTSAGARRLRLGQLKPSQRQSIERSLLRDQAQDWLMKHLTDAESSATIGDDPAAMLATLAAEAEGTPAEHVVTTAQTPAAAAPIETESSAAPEAETGKKD
jgi:trigger factor